MRRKIRENNKQETIGEKKITVKYSKKRIEKEAINENNLWKWLKSRELKAETGSLITVCEEQSIATNYLRAKIGTDPFTTLCKHAHFWRRRNIWNPTM